MRICPRPCLCHRQHAADPAQPRVRGNRLRDSRQGRVHEPRAVGQGRAALYIIRDAVARGRIATRRHHRRGHAGNTGIGLALVGPSMGFRSVIVIPETQSQEKGHAAAGRRRTGRGARRSPTRTPTTMCAIRAVWPPNWPRRPNRMARSGPTSSTIPPTVRRIWKPPARKSGNRPAARSTALSARSARAARWRAWRWPATQRGQDRSCRPEGAALYSFLYQRRIRQSRLVDHQKGSGRGTHHRQPEGFTPTWRRIPDAEALPVIFDLLEYEGLCLAARRGEYRRRNPHGAARWGRVTPSSRCCAITARATRPSFSTRFPARQRLPVPAGWRASPPAARSLRD